MIFTEHAGRAGCALDAHTVGGVGARLLCPLTSLLGRVAGDVSPAARLGGCM